MKFHPSPTHGETSFEFDTPTASSIVQSGIVCFVLVVENDDDDGDGGDPPGSPRCRFDPDKEEPVVVNRSPAPHEAEGADDGRDHEREELPPSLYGSEVQEYHDEDHQTAGSAPKMPHPPRGCGGRRQQARHQPHVASVRRELEGQFDGTKEEREMSQRPEEGDGPEQEVAVVAAIVRPGARRSHHRRWWFHQQRERDPRREDGLFVDVVGQHEGGQRHVHHGLDQPPVAVAVRCCCRHRHNAGVGGGVPPPEDPGSDGHQQKRPAQSGRRLRELPGGSRGRFEEGRQRRHDRCQNPDRHRHHEGKDPGREAVEGPDVPRPVVVDEAPAEGEEPFHYLQDLPFRIVVAPHEGDPGQHQNDPRDQGDLSELSDQQLFPLPARRNRVGEAVSVQQVEEIQRR